MGKLAIKLWNYVLKGRKIERSCDRLLVSADISDPLLVIGISANWYITNYNKQRCGHHTIQTTMSVYLLQRLVCSIQMSRVPHSPLLPTCPSVAWQERMIGWGLLTWVNSITACMFQCGLLQLFFISCYSYGQWRQTESDTQQSHTHTVPSSQPQHLAWHCTKCFNPSIVCPPLNLNSGCMHSSNTIMKLDHETFHMEYYGTWLLGLVKCVPTL